MKLPIDDSASLDAGSWSDRGAAAVQRGDFPAALDAYLRARDCSRGRAEEDLAELNVAMVRLQMGDAKRGEDGLREILLRAADQKTAFHAAYNLASSLRQQGRHERALSYARRAMERAKAAGGVDLEAPVHNLLGNIHLSQNYLDEALREYRVALRLRKRQPGDTRFSRAILEENIGYCLLLMRRIRAGMASLLRALALAEEVGDGRCRAECLQDLCYGHLVANRYAPAIEQGLLALESARRGSFRDIEENCHYLLGEIGSRTGETELRDRHFEALQALHPEVPFLQEFLCTVDVTDFITLKR